MKAKWILNPLLIASSISPFVVTSCSCSKNFDFKQMQKDYRQMISDITDISPSKMFLDKIINDTKGNLIFSDLDYTSKDRAIWPAHQHLVRTVSIVVDAVRNNKTEQYQQAIKLLKHFLDGNYTNTNWWFEEIGVPRDVSNIGLFVYDDLNQEYKDKFIKIIRKGSLLHNQEIPAGRKTATNLFWFANISMKDAWFTNDVKEFELALNMVIDEIKVNSFDGFQTDGSYYQHDHQLYNNGYGRQGPIALAKIMSAFKNTDYRWPIEKLNIIVNYILDGLATTIFKGYTDYGTMGRAYTRKQAGLIDGGTTDLGDVRILKYIADLPNCPRKDDLNKVVEAWNNGQPSFTGIKYLDRSNFITMCVDGVYMSFKGTNAAMRNTEKGNGENLLGYNLSYGTSTCVMETGKEYIDISPVWDYSYIPGTSSVVESDEKLNEYVNDMHIRRKLPEDGVYGGGTIDGITISMQSTWHEVTKSTVTCFATQDGMVLVGSDLYSKLGDMHTTVEQCIINDGVVPTLSSDKQSVIHGNIVYTNLMLNDELEMTAGSVTNSWRRNNTAYKQQDVDTKNVLKITIKHPGNQNNYAYTIQPKSKLTNKAQLIIANEKVHAIKLPNGKIAAAFYDDEANFEYAGKTYSGNKGEYKIF